MGNSICASRVAHIFRVVSATVTDLVLFLFIGGDSCISSFDLLLLVVHFHAKVPQFEVPL